MATVNKLVKKVKSPAKPQIIYGGYGVFSPNRNAVLEEASYRGNRSSQPIVITEYEAVRKVRMTTTWETVDA